MTPVFSLVTGASSGIGEAVARRLARRGDRVALGGTDELAIARLGAELGDRGVPFVIDLADRVRVAAMVRAAPPIHTLALCAGICRTARLDEDPVDTVWNEVLAINLHSVYTVIKAAAPRMEHGGRIVVISSGLGKLGRPGYAAYCASKHAVLGVVKCVAKELAPRQITVNAICPGWVDTPMARADLARRADEELRVEAAVRADVEAAIPIGRMVAADEVAALVEWLASPAAAAVTGEAYNMSGGEFFA
jgi:NAD(P)-dependent dehydrogenase (short-subunit alcohol dehydrogenase family)